MDTLEAYEAHDLEELRRDADRLDWIGRRLFNSTWHGTVGGGSYTEWYLAGDYSQTAKTMAGYTFRQAVDAGMEALPERGQVK